MRLRVFDGDGISIRRPDGSVEPLKAGRSVECLPDGSVRILEDGVAYGHAAGTVEAIGIRAAFGLGQDAETAPDATVRVCRVAKIDYETRTVTFEDVGV